MKEQNGKRNAWPMALKKQTAFMIHLLFLVLFLVGSIFVYFNENYGRGLNWVREENYADTYSCTSQLESDVENIFKYVSYKNLLEKNGEINYQTDMVCVTFSSGRTVIYTLDEMIRYAKSLGYYLTDSYEVAGGPSVADNSDDDDLPLIEWKAYDPNEVYSEPGDQYASLEDLSVQVLEVLGDYYQIRNNYINQPSNLHFRVSYRNQSGQENVYTNSNDMTTEQIRSFGRYLYISGESILMDTNLKYVPENITSQLETYNLYGNNDYYIVLGLDTSYPYTDPYSTAHNQYEKIRLDYISGMVLFTLGGIGAVITLVIMIVLTGHCDESPKKIQLCRFDQIPLGAFLGLWAVSLAAAHYLTRQYGEFYLNFLISEQYWDYSSRWMEMTASYGITLPALLSLIRCYKAGVIWKNSLTCHILHKCLTALTNCSFPVRLSLCFAGYLTVDGVLFACFAYFFLKQDSLSFSYLYLVPAVIFIGFQIWIYLLLFRNQVEYEKITHGIFQMADGDTEYKIDSDGFSGKGETVAKALNNIGDGMETALKEQVKSERLKADLITNVSHDIKTPLTSIINYVDLLKREKIQDEKIARYLDILDQKSQRLKTLTEDLVEASKASSGNLKLEIAKIDLVEMIQQTNGEFEEKYQIRHLDLVSSLPNECLLIAVDGRRLWRVLENLYNNAFKYAMENSRIYVDVTSSDGFAYFTIKNVSANPLNIHADELTERFVRGDVARTTEGSGLGLSIAKDLTQLQGGTFKLYIDGDLFKAQVGFPLCNLEKPEHLEDSPATDEVVSPPGA